MWQRVRTAQLGETGGSRAFPGRPVVKRSPSREGEVYGESKKETHITMCEIDSQWGSAVWLRELRPQLCDNLEGAMGREMGGRFKREGHGCTNGLFLVMFGRN